jgi:hypothetical protein
LQRRGVKLKGSVISDRSVRPPKLDGRIGFQGLPTTPGKKGNACLSLEFINEDELVEVTPAPLRLRKKILEANRRPREKGRIFSSRIPGGPGG